MKTREELKIEYRPLLSYLKRIIPKHNFHITCYDCHKMYGDCKYCTEKQMANNLVNLADDIGEFTSYNKDYYKEIDSSVLKIENAVLKSKVKECEELIKSISQCAAAVKKYMKS